VTRENHGFAFFLILYRFQGSYFLFVSGEFPAESEVSIPQHFGFVNTYFSIFSCYFFIPHQNPEHSISIQIV